MGSRLHATRYFLKILANARFWCRCLFIEIIHRATYTTNYDKSIVVMIGRVLQKALQSSFNLEIYKNFSPSCSYGSFILTNGYDIVMHAYICIYACLQMPNNDPEMDWISISSDADYEENYENIVDHGVTSVSNVSYSRIQQ